MRLLWLTTRLGASACGIVLAGCAWVVGCDGSSGQPAAETIYASNLSEHAPEAFQSGRDGWSDSEARNVAVALEAYYKGKRVRPLEGRLVNASAGPSGVRLELADKSMVLDSQQVNRIAYDVSMPESESAKAKTLAKDANVDVVATVSGVTARASSGRLEVTFQLDGATFQ